MLYIAASNISDLINLSNFTFDAGAEPGSFMCLNVSITDDELVEETERLLVCGCSTQTAVLLLNDGCTSVYIEDNDGTKSNILLAIKIICLLVTTVAEFQFTQSSYNVSENSGVVSICLELINGTLASDVLISMSVGARQEAMPDSGCNQK